MIRSVTRIYRQPLSWLPSFGSWLHAAKLAILAYGCATVALSFIVWRFLIVGGIVGLFGGELEGIAACLLFSALIFLISLVWFILWTAVYSFCLKLLWQTPPKFLQLPATSTLVNRDFVILTLSMLPVTLVFLLHAFFQVSPQQKLLLSPSLHSSDAEFALKYFWLWYVSAASLYHRWPPLKPKRLRYRKSQPSKRAV